MSDSSKTLVALIFGARRDFRLLSDGQAPVDLVRAQVEAMNAAAAASTDTLVA